MNIKKKLTIIGLAAALTAGALAIGCYNPATVEQPQNNKNNTMDALENWDKMQERDRLRREAEQLELNDQKKAAEKLNQPVTPDGEYADWVKFNEVFLVSRPERKGHGQTDLGWCPVYSKTGGINEPIFALLPNGDKFWMPYTGDMFCQIGQNSDDKVGDVYILVDPGRREDGKLAACRYDQTVGILERDRRVPERSY